MANLSLIPSCVADAHFPKSKPELVRYAKNHCSKDDISVLKKLPNKKFKSKIELSADLGNLPAKILDAGERAIRDSWEASKSVTDWR